jgi:uncharacterized DUF497 family protein
MLDAEVIWDLEDNPEGNVQHIAQNGVTMEEVEEVLADPGNSTEGSRSSTRSITFGATAAGRYLAVAWETACDDPLTIYPITAYDARRPRPQRKRR